MQNAYIPHKNPPGRRRKPRRRIRKSFLAVVLALVAVIVLCLTGVLPRLFTALDPSQASSPSKGRSLSSALSRSPLGPSQPTSQAPMLAFAFSAESLYSREVILVRRSDQKILVNKQADRPLFPASMTKIMTAVVALEKLPNLNTPVTLPEDIYPDLHEQNASMAGFLAGEEVTCRDLLYGTLLSSGAECSVGLAIQIAGSEAAFVKLMNEKAQALGMDNTHFMNVTGLQDSDHYSSVRDIATLLEYALKNATFKDIFTSPQHSTAPTNLHPKGITIKSTLSQNIDSWQFPGGKILGGKTGYTEQAGLCLASLAEKNGEEYILVTAGAHGDHETEPFHVTDAFAVYNAIEPTQSVAATSSEDTTPTQEE